ncbi:hypothetical protein [Hydrogenophaga laconesensis]|uniref:Uncharacterized protein n=1 Tax=Hydrogenophaga laconesensis TaxID=1805971 RepID=A0ABU1V7P5_9BURK|nr:hypothetical protein [Hydrogenophaga laconesensis]MDR7093410.1 hypothetical protein [Hydrogenophaga laconesensis]
MLKTLDGSGATDAWHGWFGKKETLRTRSEVRSPVGQSGLTVNSLARLSFQDVLQYVYVREAGVVSGLQPDAPSLNERLLGVLTACHEVDTARQRLLGAMGAQQTLDDMAHLLKARAYTGLCAPAEPRWLVVMRADLGRSVEMATAMWDMASRHFTRVTHLLPAQLDGNADGCTPLGQDDLELLERLAERLGAADRFAQAREAHKVAALDGALARSRWTHAVDARRIAETRFRKERRGALAFADAVVNEHWLANSLASRVAHLCMKRHALHAVALRLPQHLGLV